MSDVRASKFVDEKFVFKRDRIGACRYLLRWTASHKGHLMLRACVVLAGLIASTATTIAAPRGGFTHGQELYHQHLKSVGLTLIREDWPGVVLQITKCHDEFLKKPTLIKAQDCFYLQAAAGRIMRVHLRNQKQPIPSKLFTPDSLTEVTILMLTALKIDDATQPKIVRIWGEAFKPDVGPD